MASRLKDGFDRQWITDNAIEICQQYDLGILTLRGLHYQLVSRGMTNSVQHYKRVVKAIIKARRDGIIAYAQFSDHDREMIGETNAEATDVNDAIEEGKDQICAWMEMYSKNRWENQPRYVELWIEKKALQGVFSPICKSNDIALCPCKGYPSLTFLHDAAGRFLDAVCRSQQPMIVYFGDHDPSGEDIPRSICKNLLCDFGADVDVQVIALTENQCLELDLPPAPVKTTDSRSAGFTGLGQIELDAVRPEILQQWAVKSIESNFDEDLYAELLDAESSEREQYQDALRKYTAKL